MEAPRKQPPVDDMATPILIVSFTLEHLMLVVSKWIDSAALTSANSRNCSCRVQDNQRDRLNIKEVDVSPSQCSAGIARS